MPMSTCMLVFVIVDARSTWAHSVPPVVNKASRMSGLSYNGNRVGNKKVKSFGRMSIRAPTRTSGSFTEILVSLQNGFSWLDSFV